MDVAHNINVVGKNNYVYGGDLADTIKVASSSSSNYIYGGKGDDILTDEGGKSHAYGQDGNDTITGFKDTYGGAGNDIITTAVYNAHCHGEEGDDTINVNADQTWIYGGVGNDTFNLSGYVMNVFGEDGDDTFNIINDSGKSFFDGGNGENDKVLGTPHADTLMINVDRANAEGVSFEIGETKNVVINGIDYKITNTAKSENVLLYSIDSEGAVRFYKSNGAFRIEGDKNKAHNVILEISNSTFHGGNLADKIVCKSADTTIYGYDGDDIIEIYGSVANVYGGNGNDKFIINGGRLHQIYGED